RRRCASPEVTADRHPRGQRAADQWPPQPPAPRHRRRISNGPGPTFSRGRIRRGVVDFGVCAHVARTLRYSCVPATIARGQLSRARCFMSDSDLIRVYRHYLASVVHFHLAAAEAAGLGPTDYQAASLLDLDGPMRAGQLAEHLGLSAGAATRVVDRLVRAGIAERTTAGEDRRR